MHFNIFYSNFIFASHILCDFNIFLAQNFKTKVLTAHKNQLLECLVLTHFVW